MTTRPQRVNQEDIRTARQLMYDSGTNRVEQVWAWIIEFGLDADLSPERNREFAAIMRRLDSGDVEQAVKIAKNYGMDVAGLPGPYTQIIEEVMAGDFDLIDPGFVPSQLPTQGPEYESWLAWRSEQPADASRGLLAWRESDAFAAYEESIVIEAVVDDAESQADAIIGEEEEDLTWSAHLLPPGYDPGMHMRQVGADEYNPFGYEGQFSRDARSEQITMSGILASEVQYGGLVQDQVDYWASQYQFTPFFAGDGIYEWASMGADKRTWWEEQLVQAGYLDPIGFNPGDVSVIQGEAFEQVLGYAYTRGFGPEFAIQEMIRNEEARERVRNRNRPGGARRPSFSIPASLREIPDYESITQDTENLFRSRMGRDTEDWEMGILADFMQEKHRESNVEKIKAARAAFNASMSGAQGLMEVEVPNPQLRTQKFIEERYANEIDRVDQIGDTASTNRLLINAITTGSRMVR